MHSCSDTRLCWEFSGRAYATMRASGRRSVVAGVASLGLIVAAATTVRLGSPSPLTSLVRLAGLYFCSSVLVTAGMYFPWISTRRVSVMTSDTPAELAAPSSPIEGFAAIGTSKGRDRVS